jgi:hypothetical protein
MRMTYVCVLSTVLASAVACSKSESPLEPTAATTLSAPKTASPAQDEQIGYLEQPLQIRFDNLTGTGTTAATYSIEVARDSGFADKVYTRADITAGSGSTTISVPDRLNVGTYFWRVRAKNGTVETPFSSGVTFGIEAQGGHYVPNEEISEERMRDIVFGTGDEFPHLTNVFSTEGQAVAAAEELLLRMIWHLQQAGFNAARQRNPSGAISNDKFTIFIRNSWRTYDVMRLGSGGVATDVSEPQDVGAPDPQPNAGIPD